LHDSGSLQENPFPLSARSDYLTQVNRGQLSKLAQLAPPHEEGDPVINLIVAAISLSTALHGTVLSITRHSTAGNTYM